MRGDAVAGSRVSRAESAYSQIRERIIAGRWAAGDTVSTYSLADELGISRTPILAALKRLEREGLVEIIPQVGCRILGASTPALEELFALRAAVEGLTAGAAARRISEDELAELEVLVRRLEAAAGRDDRAAGDELNARFHLRIAEASALPHLIQTTRGVWASLRFQLASVPEGPDLHREAVPEHREIYAALQRRAPKRAQAAAERHAALSGARYVRQLREGHGPRLDHRALIYRADEDFLAAAVPFVQEGLERGERILVFTTPHNLEILSGALDGRGGEVEFRSSSDWYHVPSHTILAYERYVEHADSARVRVIGEPVWDRLAPGAMTEWTRYESILNVEFALAPLSLLCPYDARALPDAVVEHARRTHPEVHTGATHAHSAEFTGFRSLTTALDERPLEEPRAAVREHAVDEDLASVRRFALDQAHAAGVTGKRLVDALLAVQEVAANAVSHGPGRGTLRTWVEHGEIVYEIRDEGPGLTDPLVGHLMLDPALRAEPRGLWIARLLCDLVEVRSAPDGLVVRLHIKVA